MNGGVMFARNAALGAWTATYATGPLLTVRMRTAASIGAAWADEETLLSYCPYFFVPGSATATRVRRTRSTTRRGTTRST